MLTGLDFPGSRKNFPCPGLYIVVVFTTNMQLPTVRFEPRSSHTAVRHVTNVTARPLRPATVGGSVDGSVGGDTINLENTYVTPGQL